MTVGGTAIGVRYENPVLPGFHPDPTVCRAGEDYYLATSTFEYFPGVPLYHSENLADWEPIGHCLTRDEQLPLDDVDSSEGVFAPTLRHHDGTFYLVTTNVAAGGHFVVTAEDPRGEWSDPVWVDAPGYDPDLFWDDGEAYFTYANDDAVRQTSVDLETGETGVTGEAATIWEGLDGAFTEAPHIYEVDGTYYLLAAEGGTHTQHMVSVARSDDPTGPFEDHPDNPIFSHRSRVMRPIAATGHGDLVRANDGSWWMTFLGIRQQGGHVPYHTLGRETFLAPVTWEDGWPVVNDGDLVEPEMDVVDTELTADGDRSWTRTSDPFDGDELGPEWNYRRNPERERYSLEENSLVVRGGPDALDDYNPAFVGRRQQRHDSRATARLQFEPDGDEEAGLTVFRDEDHHYDLAVVDDGDGGRLAQVRLRIDGLSDVVGERSLPDGEVTLAVESTETEYAFAAGPASAGTDELDELATADARYVSTEVATGFTGVYYGLYATGNGAESGTPARFTDFASGPSE